MNETRKMTPKTAAKVDEIRSALGVVTDADVFVSIGGDALILTDGRIIHVDTNGVPTITLADLAPWEI